MVTSDSLASESITGGGSFGADSDARGPMDQPSSSTTTNTTDTSGATTLDPAPTAEAREAQEGWSETSAMNAGSQLGGNDSGSGAGPTYSSVAGGGSSSGSSENDRPVGSGGAKGQNIQEGGFSSDEPNASFTQDIGGKDDPGRVALGAFQARDAPVSGGAGPRQGEISNDGQYDALGETSA